MSGYTPRPNPEQVKYGQGSVTPKLTHSLPSSLTSVPATSSKGLRGSIQGSTGPGG